jgi:hypothetical protein
VTRRLLVWAFDHRADLLAALVYGCLAYLSFNALADYANGHHLFPEPWGGYAFAIAIDGSVLYAFISFRRAPWLAGLLLVTGATATYTLQRWHAEKHQHALVVAGVVPGLMVLVTFAWHRIREAVPPVPGVPTVPVPGSRERQPVAPVRPSTSARPSGLTLAQRRRVEGWVGEGRTNKSQMARDLGLSDRAKKERLAPLVDELVGRNNGQGSMRE